MSKDKLPSNAKANELAAIRKAANRQLIEALQLVLDRYPSQRFGQALLNFGFVVSNDKHEWLDEYNLEPDKLLLRVRGAIHKVQQSENSKPLKGK